MPITYKTVIASAIQGFNTIQNNIAINLSYSELGTVLSSGSTKTGASLQDIYSAVAKLACIKDTDIDRFYTGNVDVYKGGVLESQVNTSERTYTIYYEDGTSEVVSSLTRG